MPNKSLPDYFELLRQMTGIGGSAPFGPGTVAGAVFDPEEIEKKSRELQTVLVWLQVQSTAVELSIKALEYQRDTLDAMRGSRQESGQASAEDQAGYAAAFDPAQWMKSMMPNPPAQSQSRKQSSPGKGKAKPPKKP